MGEDLKHIDELFKQGLSDAQMSPPPGVFEQCMEQLDASAHAGAGTNSSTWWNGLLKSPWAILGTAVVVGVTVFLALGDGEQKNSKGKSVQTPEAQVSQVEVGAGSMAEDGVALSNKEHATVAEQALQSSDVSGDKAGVASVSSGSGSVLNQESPTNEKTSATVESNSVAPKNNRVMVAENKVKPCAVAMGSWRPVIAENVGGSVSLDLVGSFHDMKIHWGDGEVGGIIGHGDAGNSRLNHVYYVLQRKNFTLKLVNRHREIGSGLVCADSQRINVAVSPSNEVSEVFVPDVFTPNGDGTNDVFFVEMPKPLQYDITILDAKQRTVFRSNDYLSRWTGMCSESECKEDTYRVILAYKYSGDSEWKYIRKQIKLIR